MTAVVRGRPRPVRTSLSDDAIIHAEQLACVLDQLAALSAHRQHVIGVLRGLARCPTVGLTTAERASVTQEVSAVLATRRAIAEAWDDWWTAYCRLLQEPAPHAADGERGPALARAGAAPSRWS